MGKLARETATSRKTGSAGPPRAQGSASCRPAQGGEALAGHGPGLHDFCWHDAGPAQHQAAVPADHCGRRSRRRLGAARVAAYLR